MAPRLDAGFGLRRHRRWPSLRPFHGLQRVKEWYPDCEDADLLTLFQREAVLDDSQSLEAGPKDVI
jgi:hypothetical protein